MTPNRKQDIAYSMSALIDSDSYDDVIFRYGLTALYNGGDLQIENVDLALTKDGDLRLGAIPYNAMFRLVQSWRYNAPAMRLMFDTIYELRNAKPELEQNLEEILSRGPALGRLIFAFKKGASPHISNFEHRRYRTNVWQYKGVNTIPAV